MGEAIITIKTYNDCKGTKIRYIPQDINPYIVIGVLEEVIERIKIENLKKVA